MYKTFTINNFRGFKKFQIKNLEKVNLITGVNNIGKSAFLEALWIHQGGNNPSLGIRVEQKRSMQISFDEFLLDLFHNFGNQEIQFTSIDVSDEKRKTIISQEQQTTQHLPLNDNGDSDLVKEESSEGGTLSHSRIKFEYIDENNQSYSASVFLARDQKSPENKIGINIHKAVSRPLGVFMTPEGRVNPVENAERLGKLLSSKKQKPIINILQLIEPKLMDLDIIPINGTPVIHGDIGEDRLIPLPLLGDGMNRVCSYALAISRAENGIVLIDEIENGLYYSIIEKVWKSLAKLAIKNNVQLFATTHSEECIKSAYSAFIESSNYEFKLHRFDKINDQIAVTSYTLDELGPAIEQGLEVR